MFERRRADPKNVAAIILGGGDGAKLFPLTKRAATPAVPVGGCYRMKQVLAATQTPGETGKKWFQGTTDAVRKFLWVFESLLVFLSMLLEVSFARSFKNASTSAIAASQRRFPCDLKSAQENIKSLVFDSALPMTKLVSSSRHKRTTSLWSSVNLVISSRHKRTTTFS
ncbi:PREDICTED: uncharacterized protein LOC104723918 isoform X2 [Camelina sativa]|uniref:Uncharacterized protein LOC104723918 isoform X2 n=1 Tax=Camelina sativa TaxID=90675 RepID=A0ABM1QN22_CAMSA|nr:PREDICTED: uncharacterized protein LOC104723918 isoform X2 [Camelina sativa]